jgi:outer membrane receptor for ferrienterochelin and colicins
MFREVKKISFTFIVILLFLNVALPQTGGIRGTVTANGHPVEGVTIALQGLQKGAVTGKTGQFFVSGIHYGNHILKVSAIGYQPLEQKIQLAEEVVQLHIELQAINSSMNEIVVSGTLKPVMKLESPVAVEVYTPQFLKKNPSPSIFEALQNVNGVRPQLNCSVCNTGDIHINGLEGPYTMVTIDGMPIVSSLASVYGLFGIPNQLIERIEIVKGPASGLYGSEAVGGLINIITKNPSKAPALSLDFMGTSWKELLADAGVRWKAGKNADAILGVNYFSYLNPIDHNNDNFTDVTNQHRISLFNKWGLQRKDNRTASLAWRYFYEDRWGGDMRWNKSLRGSDSIYGESIYTNRLELIGNYQLPAQEKFLLSWSYNYHHQDSYYGSTAYFAKQHIGFAQLTWDKTIGRHDILSGTALRYNYYDDNSVATTDIITNKNKPDKILLPGIFIQDEWKINEQHTLLTGLRYDYNKVHGNIFTPRLAYKWKAGPASTFRLNAGTGFRVVNLFTEDHAALTGAREVVIKEKLKPERSYNINLNYNLRVPMEKSYLGIDATTWYTRFSNQIIADYDTDPDKIIYDNLNGYAVSKGVSVNIEFNHANRLKALIGATVQDVKRMDEQPDGKLKKKVPVLVEKWSGTWSISYSFPEAALTIDYTGNIYGPMRLPLLGPLDPRRPESPVWSLQNIQFTKKFNQQFEVYAGIKNLLNWTPAKNNPFLIARSHDPFDKQVQYDANGQVVATPENPYALTFDPAYVYAPNQGIRAFLGFRLSITGNK